MLSQEDFRELSTISNILRIDDLIGEEKIKTSIEIINARVQSLGYSSRKIIGQDDLDFKNYDESLLCSKQMEGSLTLNMNYPYNDIMYNKEVNEWKMLCAQIYFRIYYNLIPNEIYTNTTFPSIINIRRSNGKLQRARLRKNSGFRISKKSVEEDAIPTSRVPKLYLRVEYDSVDINLEDYSLPRDFYKDIPIQDIAEFNPNIKEFEITFKLPDYLCYDYNGYKYSVVKYYHELHYEWCETILYPLVEYIKKKYDINIKINTHII